VKIYVVNSLLPRGEALGAVSAEESFIRQVPQHVLFCSIFVAESLSAECAGGVDDAVVDCGSEGQAFLSCEIERGGCLYDDAVKLNRRRK